VHQGNMDNIKQITARPFLMQIENIKLMSSSFMGARLYQNRKLHENNGHNYANMQPNSDSYLNG